MNLFENRRKNMSFLGTTIHVQAVKSTLPLGASLPPTSPKAKHQTGLQQRMLAYTAKRGDPIRKLCLQFDQIVSAICLHLRLQQVRMMERRNKEQTP
jgi:hypothetical protein